MEYDAGYLKYIARNMAIEDFWSHLNEDDLEHQGPLKYFYRIGLDQALDFFTDIESTEGDLSLMMLLAFMILRLLPQKDTEYTYTRDEFLQILQQDEISPTPAKILNNLLSLPADIVDEFSIEDIFMEIAIEAQKFLEKASIFEQTRTSIGIEIELLDLGMSRLVKSGDFLWLIFLGIDLPFELGAMEMSTRYSFNPRTQIALAYLLLEELQFRSDPTTGKRFETSLHITTEIPLPPSNLGFVERMNLQANFLALHTMISKLFAFGFATRQRLRKAEFFSGGREVKAKKNITAVKSGTFRQSNTSFLIENRMLDISDRRVFVAIDYFGYVALAEKIWWMLDKGITIPGEWSLTQEQCSALARAIDDLTGGFTELSETFKLDRLNKKHSYKRKFSKMSDEDFNELQTQAQRIIMQAVRRIRRILHGIPDNTKEQEL